MVGEGTFGKDSGARCVRNVLAAAACREVGGWMGGWGEVKTSRITQPADR